MYIRNCNSLLLLVIIPYHSDFSKNLFHRDRHLLAGTVWLPPSARLRPSSILPTDTAINYPQNIGTPDTDGGWDLPPVAGNAS